MFKAKRMGLLNFWLYDDEEYELFDGKILLRGHNGSGKSVTMQSFIPLILDGNKTPKRLDTFGGSDKHIEYYLLDETKDVSTGYLYMEFFDEELDKYITIGIGLHARRGKPTEFYGFALKDGSRINKDFFLYKLKDGFNKSPLTKMELKTKLAPNNIFVESAKEYKKMVNNLLYGFKNIDSYDEFINVILQIRSPKLSRDYKPSTLMQTLNDVLPPLSDEDLLPLSDTIESLNSTKEQINDLSNKIKLLTNFIKIYNNYNETILYGKAKEYVNKKAEHANLIKSEKECAKKISELKKSYEEVESNLKELNHSYEKAQADKKSINNSDIESITEKLVELEKIIADTKSKISKTENSLEDISSKLRTLKKEYREYEDKLYTKEKELKKDVSDIENLCSEINFEELLNLLPIILTGEIEDFSSILDLVEKKKKELEQIRIILEQKEEYNKKIEIESSKYEELKKEYENLCAEITICETKLEEDKDNFIDALIAINKQNKELILKEEDLKEIFNIIEDYNPETFNTAYNKYISYYQKFFENLTKELLSFEANLEQTKNEYKKEQEKLTLLQNETEVILEENYLEQESIAYLEEQNIAYLPFYKAIEFKSNLDEATKNNLEANLLSSGLLNAKIIKESDILKLKDKNISYVIPMTKKKENLTKYFTIVENTCFASDYLKSILESISVDKNDVIHINDKSYQFDFLKGNNPQYESKYIGYLARKLEHEKLVAAEEKIVNELNLKIERLTNLSDNSKSRINNLNMEKEHFPKNNNLRNIVAEIERLNTKNEIILNEEHQCEENLRKLNNELSSLLLELNKLKKDNKIPLNLPSYKEACAIIMEIKTSIYELKTMLNTIKSTKELIDSKKAHIESSENNQDELFGVIALANEELDKYEIEHNSINETLNTDEYKELSIKLKDIEEILNSYPAKSSEYSKMLGVIESDIKNEEEKIADLNNNIKQSDTILEIYYNILTEEHNLGYTLKDYVITKDNVGEILKSLSNANRDKITATSNYFKGLNDYRQSLLDYAINDIVIFPYHEASIASYIEEGIPKDILEDIYKEASRQDITATYQGKKVNLYYLLDSIKDDYETSKYFLSEKDRHLFEDILLKTIGGKIKEKINNATNWVKNINKIMEDKQKNSNLRFYLSWISKSKESLEEMDTKELVEIFKLDPETLREEDTNRLIKHFRTKISHAEETMEGSKLQYIDIVSNILDYRNWFEFKIYYQKGDSKKQELSDKIFSVFSGGEKAKTMYIPLFACASAKLSSANSNAPRLIALDEAFAGVDDDNIEEMFGILKSFNLDYILTSQALWCDYGEIKDIAICELFSDISTKTLAVKRYRWNGISRVALDE